MTKTMTKAITKVLRKWLQKHKKETIKSSPSDEYKGRMNLLDELLEEVGI